MRWKFPVGTAAGPCTVSSNYPAVKGHRLHSVNTSYQVEDLPISVAASNYLIPVAFVNLWPYPIRIETKPDPHLNAY